MPMPDYRIQGVPQMQQRQGPLGALGEFAKGKALSAGLEAAFPGGGFAAEAAQEVLPAFLAGGGPLGGGQTEKGLKEARALGALSQKEYLAAMKHGGYLKADGGEVKPWWARTAEVAAEEKAKRSPEVDRAARKKLADAAKKDGLKIDPSIVGSLLPLLFEKGGSVQKPMYQRIGGMTPGPLGMSDMLEAGKGKDVAKVTYKKKGGDIEDTVEIGYHAPLAAKPKGE